MKYLILFFINLYWFLIPQHKRRECIFKKSCSNFVFDITKEKGFKEGLKAIYFRMRNCNSRYDISVNPYTGRKEMMTLSGNIFSENEIAESIVKCFKTS